MPPVEIEEAELTAYKQGMALLSKLGEDPKARKKLQAAIKEVQPEYRTDDDVAAELAAPHLEKVTELTKTLEERLSAMDKAKADEAEAAARTKLETGFSNLIANAGATEEGIKAVKELMVERNIADPEAAWLLYNKINPPPAPAPSTSSFEPQRWEITNDADDLKAWFANPDRMEDREIAKTLTEMRNGAQAAV